MSTIAAVIVNYNYADYVADAVNSVLKQTVPFDEVIVVDDGSTDESLRVIEQFAPAVKIVAKTNGGQLSAVWAGVAAATSEYTYVLDSDDRAGARLVETIRPQLESRPVKLQFQLQAVTEAGAATESVFPSYPASYTSDQMIDDNRVLGFYLCAPTSGNVFRTEYLARLAGTGHLQEKGAFVDGVPAQLAPYFGSVTSLNEPLAQYRVHGRSDSQWGQPTTELLDRELREYGRRWEEVRAVLAEEGVPAPRYGTTAYTLERRLMSDVLDGRRPSAAPALAFARLVRRSSLPRSQKVLLCGWAFGLVVLPKRKAETLALSRRSPARRGPLLRWAANLARARGATPRT
ncbi:glycosyltransferase family 2 protein [Naasia sp. SYSU D00057]|uniref:glycosyltransferase family 2 protein n=1 Tax=Naasia sp. SYSU D00057 TaxID=2817380 RepID=UPI001B304CB5|nr:glycosyltransferase family 2 protein [Naasia sp. SYSU D00057]